jgi:hypothetical protein
MQNARPTFLTVLCILTFIASAWGIFNAYTSYSSADIAPGVGQEAMDKVKDQMDEASSDEASSAIVDKMMNSVSGALQPENIKKNGIATGISSLLTLLGAILMWGLNRKGYFVYVAGVLVSIIAPMVIYGGGIMGMATAGWSVFTGVLFSILYFLNLKHMS